MTITRNCGLVCEQTTDVIAAKLHPYEHPKALPQSRDTARYCAPIYRKSKFLPAVVYGRML
jgi:hypothetical protein